MSFLWKIFVLILFFRHGSATNENGVESTIRGILFENNSSSICSATSLINLNNFVLSTFLRLGNDSSNLDNRITLFEIRDSTNTFELSYDSTNGHFLIIFNKEMHVYPKRIALEEWTKLRVEIIRGSEIKFEINYRITRNNTDIIRDSRLSEWVKRKKHKFQILPTSVGNSVIYICAGKYGKTGSFVGSIAGTYLVRGENANKSLIKDSCIFDINQDTTSAFPDLSLTNTSGSVKEEMYRLEDICWDTHVFLLLEDSSYYDEHLARCSSLNGRLLQNEEIRVFVDKLTDMFVNGSQYSWLYGGAEGALSLSVLCHVYDFQEGKFSVLPCIVELDHNFCMVPKYTDFYYYGSLIKYDKYYTLVSQRNAMVLLGDEGTVVEKVGDHWLMYSDVHKEYVTLPNAVVPVGRNEWENFDKVTEHTLTFTYCEPDHFSCSYGACLTLESRCNGTVECLDNSDEESCMLIQKKPGYLMNRTPPPRKKESLFTVKYFAHIFNIADISSSDGTVVVDIYMTMTWYDPRITFGDPIHDEEVDCSTIWRPLISMADGVYNGFQIKFDPYRSNCIAYSSKFDYENIKHRSARDPYMGHYVDGNDLPITYVFSGLINVPCRFDFRKYPFGMQTCNITIWPDNALLTSKYKMEILYPNDFKGVRSNKLKYDGRRNLGEFYFLSATHRTARDNRMVVLTIKLENLSGFHLLNSFIPSVLISIITYSTLFFPIVNFNERVMVSLTAQLVLATLFNQASNSSVKTPYFKYLDIWYVSLISFGFCIVICNVLIHKLNHYNNTRVVIRPNKSEAPDEEPEIDPDNKFKICLKNVYKINIVFEIAFAVFFLLFLLIFSLRASDKM